MRAWHEDSEDGSDAGDEKRRPASVDDVEGRSEATLVRSESKSGPGDLKPPDEAGVEKAKGFSQ